MLAVDTNVVVLILTRDDTRQLAAAEAIFRSQDIWIPKTVLLEAEWVLRNQYDLAAPEVREALQALVALPNVSTEDEANVVKALDRPADGLDFADALHVYSSEHVDEFVTFDQRLSKRAQRIGLRVRAL